MPRKTNNTPSTPSAPKLDIATVKADFVAALTGHCSAKEKLQAAFDAAKSLIPDLKTLRDTLKDWAVKHALTEFRLEVYANNTSAIKAYEKAGFKSDILEMRMNISGH